MIDDDVGAVLAHRREAGVRPAAADHREAARVRELDAGDADAAGRAVDEHRFARLRVRALEQRAVGGAVRHAERRALRERRARRQRMDS